MSITDYVNRTADLLVLHGNFPTDGEQQVAVTLAPAGTGGLLCTGIQKTAQRVLYVLLTKLGSIPYRLGDGTPFLLDAERGTWRTTSDVRQSFSAAKLYLMRQLLAVEDVENDPEDEIVEDVTLENVVLMYDRVSVHLRLVVASGEDFEFIAPISVTTH